MEEKEKALKRSLEEEEERMRMAVGLASQIRHIKVRSKQDAANLGLLLDHNPSWSGGVTIETHNRQMVRDVMDIVAGHNSQAGGELVTIAK